MKYIYKSIIFWILAIAIGAFIAIYQRMTGPTYPVYSRLTIDNEEVNGKLIRTYSCSDDAPVHIIAKNDDISGFYRYRRFKSYDEWHTDTMKRHGDTLTAFIPQQPPAGKVMYQIVLKKAGAEYLMVEEPVIIRYKGFVPSGLVIAHVLIIFLAFIFSVRTGIEALANEKHTFYYTIATLVLLLIGGLILGPVMQKYAFGAYWTGWPVGHDLTDNKTAFAFIFWVVALFAQLKNRKNRIWPIVASVVLLVVFLIPHSVLGSEIDFTETEPQNNTEVSETYD
ncbi:MAG: hypothetical protein RQ866_03395 [Bacteroidales bacterium]|nr:hypothetical protein [Bacteroidales bacterium]